MNKLQELIDKLCPNGVQYKKISELCTALKKGTLKTSDLKENGKYPVINSGRELYGYYDDFNNKNAITLAARGEYAGYISYFKDEFWAGGLCYPYSSKDEKVITNKFLYYYLKSKEKIIMETLVARGSIPALNKSDLDRFMVAVPPLDVQHEIVKILDKLTAISTELSTKLLIEQKYRQKQYKEYINILLSEQNMHEYKKIKLKDLFDFRNGLSKGKEFFGSGTPFIRYTDVYNNRFLHIDDIKERVNCTNKELETLKVNRGDVLFTRTSEVAEEVGYSSVMLDDIENCVFNGFTIKGTPKTELLIPEFCAFCFSTDKFRQYVSTRCAFTTRASLTGKTIGEFELCVPSIQEQKKIIKQLMSLYKLVTDISDRLPKEIEARQKQYEYYRDKLLTFKELKVSEV